METLKLATEVRTETGKGAARRARARGLIPAVFYGPSSKPVNLAVAPKAFTHALSSPRRRNSTNRQRSCTTSIPARARSRAGSRRPSLASRDRPRPW